MHSADGRAGNAGDSTPSSANDASAARASRASESASSSLRRSDSTVCVWPATVPVGTWWSSTRSVRRRNIRQAAAAYRANGSDVRASSSVQVRRLVL